MHSKRLALHLALGRKEYERNSALDRYLRGTEWLCLDIRRNRPAVLFIGNWLNTDSSLGNYLIPTALDPEFNVSCQMITTTTQNAILVVDFSLVAEPYPCSSLGNFCLVAGNKSLGIYAASF